MPQAVVDIGGSEGDAFVDPTGCIETDGKNGTIAIVFESFVKYEVNFIGSEYFCLSMPIYLHPSRAS